MRRRVPLDHSVAEPGTSPPPTTRLANDSSNASASRRAALTSFSRMRMRHLSLVLDRTRMPMDVSRNTPASALATDESGPVTYEVSYAGEWNPIVPSGFNFTLSGSEGIKYTNTQLRARDANGNVSAHLTVPPYKMSSNLSAAITALSPVGYWKLNEKGGSVASDYSGNNRPGAYVGGYELNAGNGYVDLNGGYVEIPDADAFSIPTGNGVTLFALFSPREAQSTSRRFIMIPIN